MAILINQSGIPNVGLTRNRMQHKRAVAPLVAEVWLPRPHHDAFDTPINLNGDRLNNTVPNLAWRPRWFAVRFFRQFHLPDHAVNRPIEDMKTGEMFEDSWEAVKKYGLLNHDIIIAMLNNTYVWPTYQRFRLLGSQILERPENADYNRRE
jgi:hypothetical protein